jgi:3-hydroxymyristoyl/3-hydroxydecanoyl-(acyl carrier protein) dehydratase
MVLPHRPPVLQLDRVDHCAATLDALEASKALAGSDPMLVRTPGNVAYLSTSAMIEAMAQCCGLLLRLRWLDRNGVDVATFAAGDDRPLAGRDIPRSVLAESQARFAARVQPGQMLQLSARLLLSRGDMHSFATILRQAGSDAATARIMLAFPRLDDAPRRAAD